MKLHPRITPVPGTKDQYITKAAIRRQGGDDVEREQTTIRLPGELLEKLRQEADKRGYTTRDLIVFILWDYVHSSNLPK